MREPLTPLALPPGVVLPSGLGESGAGVCFVAAGWFTAGGSSVAGKSGIGRGLDKAGLSNSSSFCLRDFFAEDLGLGFGGVDWLGVGGI